MASKICLICGEALTNERDGMALLDGTSVHFDCFKCNKCGKVQDPNDKVALCLLRTKIAQLKKGEYVCEDCNGGPNKDKASYNDLMAAAKVAAEKQRSEAVRQQQLASVQGRKAAAAAEVATEQAKRDKFTSKPIWTLVELQDKTLVKEYNVNDYAKNAEGQNNKEMLLSDAEFRTVFGVDKACFETQPKWKKDAAKKKHGVF